MGYENRLPPEGINVGKTNVALEMLVMLGGFALSVATLVVILYVGGSLLAGHIPFSWELAFARSAGLVMPEAGKPDPRSQALQNLADRLARQADLPKGLSFNVQYVDDDEVNAFASLGGSIRVHGGLVKQLHSENAIALVLAHEMAHVIHRDPAQTTGGQLMVGLAINLLMGVVGLDGLDKAASATSSLALLTFSREAERQADALGLQMVGRLYGHMGGVTEVFERLAAYENEHGMSVPEFLASHPETAGRNESLRMEAQKLGIPLQGLLTPVPASLLSDRK